MEFNEEIKKEEVVELITKALNYFERVLNYKEQLNEYLNNEEYNKLFNDLADLFEGLTWLNSLLEHLILFIDVDVKNIQVGTSEKSIKNIIEEYNQFLNEIEGCLKSKDYMLLNDIIEYEFFDMIRDYQFVFVELGMLVKKAPEEV